MVTSKNVIKQFGSNVSRPIEADRGTLQELYVRMAIDTALFSTIIYPHHLRSKEVPDFHREVYEIFKQRRPRVAIAWPREHAKTTVAALFYATQEGFYKKSKHIILMMETLDQAEEQLLTIRSEIESNVRIRQFFGDLTAVVSEEELTDYEVPKGRTRITQRILVLSNGVVIRARGRGQKVRGRKVGAYRPDLIICDDLESEDSVATPERRMTTKRWFSRAVVPSLDINGRIIMIANYTHEDCLIKSIVDRTITTGSTIWDTFVYRIIDDNGKTLWPEWWTVERYEDKKQEYELMDDREGFYQEYFNETVTEERRQFKKRLYFEAEFVKLPVKHLDMKSCDGRQFKTSAVGSIPVTTYIGWDLAIGSSVGADYAAIVVVALDYDKNRYILDYWAKRGASVSEQIAILISYCDMYEADAIKIETNSFQVVAFENLKDQLYSEDKYYRLVPLKNYKNKISRILRIQPSWEAGKWFFKQDMGMLKEELHGFPAAKHEHLLDAIEMADRYSQCPEFSNVSELLERKRVSNINVAQRDEKEFNWLLA